MKILGVGKMNKDKKYMFSTYGENEKGELIIEFFVPKSDERIQLSIDKVNLWLVLSYIKEWLDE